MYNHLNKYTWLAILSCLAFLLVGFGSVIGFNWRNLKYSGSAITGDEVTYLASGYYSLITHKNFFNPEHPPLIKDIAAMPLFLLKPVLPTIANVAWQKPLYPYQNLEFAKEGEIKNNQFDWGRLFLFNNQNDADQIAFWARLAVMIFNSILLFLLYFSLKQVWPARVALGALLLIIILPLSLAHGSLVVLDFSSAILQLLAIVWFTIFLRQLVDKRPDLSGFLLAILFIVLSLLAKLSSLVLLPVLFLVGLVYVLVGQSRRFLWWNYLLAILLMSVIGWLAVTVYYLPHVYKMSQIDAATQINHLLPDQVSLNQAGYLPQVKKIILTINASDNKFRRAAAEYLLGVALNIRRADLSEQQQLYFRGSLYGLSGAGLQYYPVLLLTKIPLAMLLLIIMAIGYFVFNCCRRVKPDLLFVIFFAYALFFLFLATYFKLQMGLRYVLPVIFITLILSAKVWLSNWQPVVFKTISIEYIFIGLVSLAAFVTLLYFPYYISYYNILGGGTKQGYQIAVDSNYDWGGQDIKRLAVWARDNNVERLYAYLFTNAEPAYYLGDIYLPYQPTKDSLPVAGSYVAISAHYYQTGLVSRPALKEKYFNQINLVGRAGQSIFIFKMP